MSMVRTAPITTRTLLRSFVLATVPVFMVGAWNLGYQSLTGFPSPAGDPLPWPQVVLGTLGFGASGWLSSLLFGLLYLAPRVLVVLGVSYAWNQFLSVRSERPEDPAWLMSGWLFVLLLPPAAPLGMVVLAMSFAALFGSYIFGGTGRYLVSPALLGVLFLHFSYPGFVQAALPFAEPGIASSWAGLAANGPGESRDLANLLLGAELGSTATASVVACALGALFLVWLGAVSWRTIAGGLVGLVAATWVVNLSGVADPAWHLTWYWHIAVGHFAFALLFIATDPTTEALMPISRWLHGALVGVLTIALRVLDPSHPEGTLFAVLLAGLTVPLLDHGVLRFTLRRNGFGPGVP